MLKTIVIGMALILGFFASYAQPTSQGKLDEADSLFAARKYTESFELYQYLLEVEHTSSPAMLLKMAFIQEGLGNYSGALYYLNTYYLKTADRRVLNKMDELAKKKNLIGYEFTDLDFLLTNFYRFYDAIVYSLLALATLMLSFVYYMKLKLRQSPVIPAVFMVVFLTGLFYTLNYGRTYKRAIISADNTYLMSGPSAGSEVIAIIDPGHRVRFSERKDVWVKVEWQDDFAYVKQDKLQYLKF